MTVEQPTGVALGLNAAVVGSLKQAQCRQGLAIQVRQG